MELQKLINRAMDLRTQYEKKEKQLYGSPASDEEIAQGFLSDVNNLVKLVMAEHGKRTIAHSSDKLSSNLSHCLWSVIVLAKMHNIDLEQSFMETMDKLENHLLETQECCNHDENWNKTWQLKFTNLSQRSKKITNPRRYVRW